ncbi:MAG: type I methionyl aminopeptidase [Planctomycetaceae bacterium]|nr:MAG: type I methionyl aminopeptidase [Planctomycetaceae bacterium]
MRQAGRIVRLVLDRLGEMIAPGVSTGDLDAEAERLCLAHGATCLFKGVPGRGRAAPFPGAICASINEEVVHGIPSPLRNIRDGDIVSVDFGVRLAGWCGDAAATYIVGQADKEICRLVDVTRQTLGLAISMCNPGKRWSEIARAMQTYVEQEGFSVVTDFVGHGIGVDMHEEPKVPNYVSRELELRDIVLEEGLVLAVEPMVNMGAPAVTIAADGWTVVTKDRLPSAHFEHTVLVTEAEPEILTCREKTLSELRAR